MGREALATVRVNQAASQQLRRGYPWCYRQNVIGASPSFEKGQLVRVLDPQGNFIGQAFFASASPIAIRLLTREEREVDDNFFRTRLSAAIDRRATLVQRGDAFRLVNGEADHLPGLFVDKYGGALVIQSLSEGADVRKRFFAETLSELLHPKQIVFRDDGSGRDFEKLPREAALFAGESAPVEFCEKGNTFRVDLFTDMKTGSFLDQVDNHLRAGELGKGEGLDCFAYHGGFSLALAERCVHVLAIEQDPAAAKAASANVKRNNLGNVTVENANAFDRLHEFARSGRGFDTIVIDPPAFAKRKEGPAAALRAYKELNLRALKCLRPEGLLVSCSCSGKLSRDQFERVVSSAATDAHRSVQFLERRGAGIDHPIHPSLPESDYLKVLFLRVL